MSLRSAGETESTVLEEQRLGGISKAPAELQNNTTGVDENANQKDTLQTEIPAASQQHKSEIEGDVIEGDDEAIEEEEVEEEIEGEEEEEDNEEEEGDEDEEESDEEEEENEVEEDGSEPPAPIDLALTETAATTPNPTETTEEASIKIHAKETESNDEPPLTASSELITTNTTAITHVDDEKGDHHEKPAIPPQTYLWKEVEKSKEQGGYPWTHLYKNPLGPDDEPEVILRYTQSPVNRRRKVEEQLIDGNSREEKKAKTEMENGYEVTESMKTESPVHEPPITPETATSITSVRFKFIFEAMRFMGCSPSSATPW